MRNTEHSAVTSKAEGQTDKNSKNISDVDQSSCANGKNVRAFLAVPLPLLTT
jgi:hypothetical protein